MMDRLHFPYSAKRDVYLSTFLFHVRAWAHYLSGSLGIQTQTEAISVSMWPNLMRHGCEGTQQQQPNRVHRCVCVCEWVCSGSTLGVTTSERSLIFCSSPGVIKPKKHNDAPASVMPAPLSLSATQNIQHPLRTAPFSPFSKCDFKSQKFSMQMRVRESRNPITAHTHNWSLRKEEFFLVPAWRAACACESREEFWSTLRQPSRFPVTPCVRYEKVCN